MTCGYARVQFTDRNGRSAERTLDVRMFQGDDRAFLRRHALQIMEHWRGVSDVRVKATMLPCDTGWTPEPTESGDVKSS